MTAIDRQYPLLLETQRPLLLEDAAFALEAYMDEWGENDTYSYLRDELCKVAAQMQENLEAASGK